MRLIDSDALIKRMPSVMDMQDVYLPIHFKELLIDESPTVDAVPVIRCKDCKYYNPQQHYCEGIGNWFGYVGEWSDNGYCYKAERREA